MSEGLVLDRIFFRVFIEEGRDEMMANAMSLSSSVSPRAEIVPAAHTRELI
jgi:hypothetical protein